MYPYSVAPSDIWNYPTRTLTEKVGIERARGYSSGFSKLVDEKRFVNGVLYLLGIGNGAIVIPPEGDVMPGYTLTALTPPASGSFPACITDHDDSTACSWNIGSYLTDILQVDVNSPNVGLLLRVYSMANNPVNLRIFGSNDGTTWSYLGDAGAGVNSYGEALVFVTGYRYYKGVADGLNYTGTTYYLASFEGYKAYPLPCSRVFNKFLGRIIIFVYNAYYQLLEVVGV